MRAPETAPSVQTVDGTTLVNQPERIDELVQDYLLGSSEIIAIQRAFNPQECAQLTDDQILGYAGDDNSPESIQQTTEPFYQNYDLGSTAKHLSHTVFRSLHSWPSIPEEYLLFERSFGFSGEGTPKWHLDAREVSLRGIRLHATFVGHGTARFAQHRYANQPVFKEANLVDADQNPTQFGPIASVPFTAGDILIFPGYPRKEQVGLHHHFISADTTRRSCLIQPTDIFSVAANN